MHVVANGGDEKRSLLGGGEDVEGFGARRHVLTGPAAFFVPLALEALLVPDGTHGVSACLRPCEKRLAGGLVVYGQPLGRQRAACTQEPREGWVVSLRVVVSLANHEHALRARAQREEYGVRPPPDVLDGSALVRKLGGIERGEVVAGILDEHGAAQRARGHGRGLHERRAVRVVEVDARHLVRVALQPALQRAEQRREDHGDNEPQYEVAGHVPHKRRPDRQVVPALGRAPPRGPLAAPRAASASHARPSPVRPAHVTGYPCHRYPRPQMVSMGSTAQPAAASLLRMRRTCSVMTAGSLSLSHPQTCSGCARAQRRGPGSWRASPRCRTPVA